MMITTVTPRVPKVSNKTSLRLIANLRQFADACRTWTKTLIKRFYFHMFTEMSTHTTALQTSLELGNRQI